MEKHSVYDFWVDTQVYTADEVADLAKEMMEMVALFDNYPISYEREDDARINEFMAKLEQIAKEGEDE